MSSEYSIFVSTFNCGKCLPIDQPIEIDSILASLIPSGVTHDIYALGLQELVAIWQGSFPLLLEELLKNLAIRVLRHINSLSESRTYKLAASNSVGAIGLLVFVDANYGVMNPLKASAKCGALYSSLKGATAVKFSIQIPGKALTDSFLFVTAHLAANEGELQKLKRESDYHTIVNILQSELGSFEGNHVFFCGDFNFRSSKWAVDTSDYSNLELLQGAVETEDELNVSRKAGKVFKEFQEAPIKFAPTYKFHVSAPSYNPKRIPSWCDRVLFRKYDKNPEIIEYNSCERVAALQFTDHLPVFLQLRVPHFSSQSQVRFTARTAQSTTQKLLGNVSDLIIGYSGWLYVAYGPLLPLLAGLFGLSLICFHVIN